MLLTLWIVILSVMNLKLTISKNVKLDNKKAYKMFEEGRRLGAIAKSQKDKIDAKYEEEEYDDYEYVDDGEEEETEEEAEEEVKEKEEERRITANIQRDQDVQFDFVDFHTNSSLAVLSNDNTNIAADHVIEKITTSIRKRLTEKLFVKAKTPECRAKISEHYSYFIEAIGKEHPLPFSDVYFEDECREEKYDFDNLPEGVGIGGIQNRTYQPARKDAKYIDHPDNLTLCYGILTHDEANVTIHLIEALYEPGHVFVIHVDGKESADETYDTLVDYACRKKHVSVVPNEMRVRVNWGGFSMVNATLQLLKHTFDENIPFHKFVHLASTTYPLASNTEIRRKIASYPLNANLFNVVFKPTNPGYGSWNYFIECDDSLHRIYRLTPLNVENHGVDLYTSSQWFISSREFAEYLAKPPPNSFVAKYLPYAEHVVVADEHFFGTILRHTHFCHYHHNENFLHVQFDRWENEVEDSASRDERKCVMPSPDHCGRSPTTMTMDYLPVLEVSEQLFARKFVDEVDPLIRHAIDIKRAEEETFFLNHIKEEDPGVVFIKPPHKDPKWDNYGVLIAARDTLYDKVPLCLGIGSSGNKVLLTPCFNEEVPKTLADQWEEGGVLLKETMLHNRWLIGPCSRDGNLRNGTVVGRKGNYTSFGPRCPISQGDGVRAGRCLDAESDRVQPGGVMHVFPCVHRWHQLFSFGNGVDAPIGSIHTVVPLHITRTIEKKKRTQKTAMCLGVYGRGKLDEEDWDEDVEENQQEYNTLRNHSLLRNRTVEKEDSKEPHLLSEWNGERLVTTRCDNDHAIVQWAFIPMVHEEIAQYELQADEEDDDEEL